MRTLATLILALSMGFAAHAHKGNKIEQRTGLKSEEVIKNDLRLQGVDVSSVQIDGQTANIVARISGEPIQLKMDRISGTLEQSAGKLQLDRKMLQLGRVELPVQLKRPELQRLTPIDPKLKLKPKPKEQ